MAITLDLQQFLTSLDEVDVEKHKSEIQQIFDEASAIIYATAQQNLHSQLRQRGKNKYGLKLSQGIKRTIYKSGKGASVYVSQKDNYIVYMQAKGTKQRHTKKGANRGKLTPKPFFKNAVDTHYKNVENYIIDKITQLITTSK